MSNDIVPLSRRDLAPSSQGAVVPAFLARAEANAYAGKKATAA